MTWEAREIAAWQDWAPGLRTLRLAGPSLDFQPGQFVRLALDLPAAGAAPGESGAESNSEPPSERVARSYSLSSAPGAPLETFLVEVPTGRLTPPLLRLEPGESVWLDPRPQGHFVLERVAPCETLWLVGTGTGLGPYLSMLRAGELWERHERVVVVQGVRTKGELAYAEELRALAAERPLRWVPALSQDEAPPGGVAGRLTSALEAGALEAAAGVELRPETSHVLACGNPAMIQDLRQLLEARGLERNRPRKPGQFTTEKYW